jgi:hypothetical protein
MSRSPFERLRRGDVTLWATLLGVLPLPIWFLVHVAVAPVPAWRGEYRPRDAGGAGVPAVAFERQLARYWDRTDRGVPGGADPGAFSARWQACMNVEAALDVPVMLVASGSASFALDGAEQLLIPPNKARRSAGTVLHLEPGVHLLSVQLDTIGWPSIALLASLDGAPPAALGSGQVAPGVSLTPPSAGMAPCAAP